MPGDTRASIRIITALLITTATSAFAEPCDNGRPMTALDVPSGPFGELGYAMAVQGDLMVVGDPKHPLSTPGHRTGAVVIYRRLNGAWTPESVVLSSGAPEFGESVAICGDQIIVAGGQLTWILDHVSGGEPSWITSGFLWYIPRVGGVQVAADATQVMVSSAESTVVLERDATSTTGWRTAANLSEGVARSTRGLAIHNDRFAFATDTQVRVFRRTGSGWTDDGTIVPEGIPPESNDSHVDVAITGSNIAVGVSTTRTAGPQRGRVDIFSRSTIANDWRRAYRIDPPVLASGRTIPSFGCSIDISGDRLAIGVPFDRIGDTITGTTRLYRLSQGSWLPERVLQHPSSPSDTWFGWQVTLAGDEVVATGAGYFEVLGPIVAPFCPSATNETPMPCTSGLSGLLEYVNLYITADRKADYNSNGGVTVQDLFDYLADWFAGCPIR